MKARSTIAAFCSVASLLIYPFAAASADTAAPEIGVVAGTAGIGGTLAVPVSPLVDIRVEGAGIAASGISVTSNGFDIAGSASEGRFSLLGDLHPARGYFAIVGGLVAQNLRLGGTASSSNGTYVINGDTYSAATVGRIDGLVKWSTVAPYLGIAGAPTNHHGVGIGFDLGAIFQGSPTTRLVASGPMRNDPTLMHDLAAEAASINRVASDLSVYPVVDLGLTYRP